jgi:hypothetical protein
MTGNPPKPELRPAIRATLDALRRRIRRYVWLEGLGAAGAWLGAAFWLSLALDWFFEPSPAVRGAALACVMVGLVVLFWGLVVRRAVVPISDSNLAMLLERRFPEFRDSLLTAVDLAGAAADECNPQLLSETCRLAEAPIGQVRLSRVFNPAPLRRSLIAAAVFVVSIAGFAQATPDLAAVWARRALLLSDELWPRNSRLVVEGFHGGVAKVARGADLELVAKADTSMPVIPDVVEVRYHGVGGLRKLMNRVGNARPDRDPYQEFSYTFRGVLAPVTFDLVGGDAAIRGLKIDVVENPTVVEMVLDCHYPRYMDRAPLSLPVTGLMQIPAGTRVTVRARSNKDLVKITVDSPLDDPPKPPQPVAPSADDPRGFVFTIDNLAKDTTLLFTLGDSDGIKSREPVRLTLAALEDRRPELSVQLRGIGSAVTSQASIPAVGRVEDDYGIARVWFEYAVDKQEPKIQPIASPPGNATQFRLAQSLDARTLALKPGQKLALSVKAEDRFDLTGRSNVGTSDRWLLDVVTPDQLRTMLQSRELVLRQRFESVIKDVTDVRDSLARVDFSPPAQSPKPEAPKTEAAKAEAPKKPPAAASKGAEPGDAPDAQADRSPERLASQRLLQVQWAQQNGRKSASETAGLAEAFAEIREELVNNRIDTEELKLRLEDGIAKPLKHIADEMFPELDRRLDRLQLALSDPAAGGESLKRALQQVDAILLSMRQVLGRMIELEDFNEAVELLKSILRAEQSLHDETKRRHKEKLRELREK